MVLAQNQKYRLIEQDREPKTYPHTYGQLTMTKES